MGDGYRLNFVNRVPTHNQTTNANGGDNRQTNEMYFLKEIGT